MRTAHVNYNEHSYCVPDFQIDLQNNIKSPAVCDGVSSLKNDVVQHVVTWHVKIHEDDRPTSLLKNINIRKRTL